MSSSIRYSNFDLRITCDSVLTLSNYYSIMSIYARIKKWYQDGDDLRFRDYCEEHGCWAKLGPRYQRPDMREVESCLDEASNQLL